MLIDPTKFGTVDYLSMISKYAQTEEVSSYSMVNLWFAQFLFLHFVKVLAAPTLRLISLLNNSNSKTCLSCNFDSAFHLGSIYPKNCTSLEWQWELISGFSRQRYSRLS
jgi:hypothetical protein